MNRLPGDNALAILGCLALGAVGVAIGSGALARRSAGQSGSLRRRQEPEPLSRGGGRAGTVIAARRLNRAAGILAFSVLADSSVEHYRGSFKNKGDVYPPRDLCADARHQFSRKFGQPPRCSRNPGYDLCSGGRDRPHRHRLSHLQRRQEDRWLLLAESLLRGAARGAHGRSYCPAWWDSAPSASATASPAPPRRSSICRRDARWRR